MSEMQEIQLKQGPIRYRDSGNGDPVVFVHGLLANGELWRDVMPVLAPDFRVIAPDWPLGSQQLPLNPGADLSPPAVAALVADFIEALGLERVTLVGNDSGGAISQMVAISHPERLARLVLTPCDAYEHFPPADFGLLQKVGSKPAGLYAIAQSMRPALARRRREAFGMLMKRHDDELTGAWMRPVRENAEVRRQTAEFIAGMSPKYTLEAAAHFSELRLPVLLAWAPEDCFFKLATAERLRNDIPDARLELIEDSYTFVSLDQPKRTAQLIADFARQTSATPEVPAA